MPRYSKAGKVALLSMLCVSALSHYRQKLEREEVTRLVLARTGDGYHMENPTTGVRSTNDRKSFGRTRTEVEGAFRGFWGSVLWQLFVRRCGTRGVLRGHELFDVFPHFYVAAPISVVRSVLPWDSLSRFKI